MRCAYPLQRLRCKGVGNAENLIGINLSERDAEKEKKDKREKRYRSCPFLRLWRTHATCAQKPWKFLSKARGLSLNERRGDTCGPCTRARYRTLSFCLRFVPSNKFKPKFKLVRARVTIHSETLLGPYFSRVLARDRLFCRLGILSP